jgi:uncharacterized protein
VDIFNEDAWPPIFDDRVIDDIIWEEIKDSPSRGDFICYQIHRPQKGRHREAATEKLRTLEGGDRLPVGYGRAVERIRKLAEQGDVNAMFHMGKLHVLGIGLPQDMVSAVAWYEKAIAHGEMRACCNLGWIYLYGFGPIFPNKKEAFRLLSIGAAHGVYIAKASLGQMYLAGDGVEVNKELGLALLKESFEEGYTNAGNHLADAYFTGKFFQPDFAAGHVWLSKVAERGDAKAMAILGFYLVAGSYGQTDVKRGLWLLEQAIEKEYMPAYLWMGNFYRKGQGVDRDLDKAREWFEKGSGAGSVDCDKVLAEMMNDLMPPNTPTSPTFH